MRKGKAPAMDWDSAGADRTNGLLGVTAVQQRSRFPDPTDVGNVVYRLRLYARSANAIMITAEDAAGIAEMLQELSARNAQLEQLIATAEQLGSMVRGQ